MGTPLKFYCRSGRLGAVPLLLPAVVLVVHRPDQFAEPLEGVNTINAVTTGVSVNGREWDGPGHHAHRPIVVQFPPGRPDKIEMVEPLRPILQGLRFDPVLIRDILQPIELVGPIELPQERGR